jgi:hypothetical protein
MSTMLQQVLVGFVVIGAAGFLVRRIIAALRPQGEAPGCDACALHEAAEPRPPATR